MSNKDICGAQTNKGNPCQRPAGWGTDSDEGKCRFHLDERTKHLKNRFVELLEKGNKTFAGCAKKIGKSSPTIWRWRQKDEAFDKRVEEARRVRDGKMAADVEDKMYQMIMSGEASATDRIFFLKNRSPERWSDKQEFKHSTGSDDDKGVVDRLREAHKALNNEEDD